ncbi:hypothetical protein StoSoilB3_42030 (plasmid) [Arthrobacter sp. StoSoilB3]|nr:hypothetical protein StoSoilB3_42030 [Arthrobacter sp. StoSoilB3]
MNKTIQARLDAAGISLPAQGTPRWSYVPYRRAGKIAFFSGKTTLVNGAVQLPGLLGDLDVPTGQEAARIATSNLLSQIDQEVGLENVEAVLKLTGYVASTPTFTEQALVIEAASTLLLDVLGSAGEHSRLAIGVASLPGGSAVEVECVVLLAD